MRFAADELISLLNRHDALDLRPCGERLEALVRALVANRADHRALDSAHDMRLVSQLFDFFEHGGFLLFRDVWFENDDHKNKTPQDINLRRAKSSIHAASSAGPPAKV